MDGFNGTVDFTKEEEQRMMEDRLDDGRGVQEKLEDGRIILYPRLLKLDVVGITMELVLW